jgi:hypothetical protein
MSDDGYEVCTIKHGDLDKRRAERRAARLADPKALPRV